MQILRLTGRVLFRVATGLTIALALLVTVARFAISVSADYRAEIVSWLSDELARPVVLESIEVDWYQFGPRVALQGLAIQDANGQALLTATRAFIKFDMLRWLTGHGGPITSLTLADVPVRLERGADGEWTFLSGDDSAINSAELLATLFGTQRVELINVTLQLIDHTQIGRVITLNELHAVIVAESDAHQLTLQAELPENLGSMLRLQARVNLETGATTLRESLTAEGFIDLTNFKLAVLSDWLGDFSLQPIGQLSLRAWLSIKQGQLTSVTAEPLARDVSLATLTGEVWEVNRLSGRLGWEHTANGQRVVIENIVYVAGQSVWPASRLELQYDQLSRQIQIATSYLQLGDLAPLLGFAAVGTVDVETMRLFRQIKPTGILKDLKAEFTMEGSLQQLSAKMLGVKTEYYETIPGIAGVSGDARWQATSGLILELDSAALHVDYPPLFRQPVRVDRTAGTISFAQAADGWELKFPEIRIDDEALQATLQGRGILSSDAKVYLDLGGHYSGGRIVAAKEYYPVGIMDSKLVAWLDRALQGGRVTEGYLAIKGWADEFPFDEGTGVFDIGFTVENAVLDYSPGWQPIEDGTAQVQFLGSSLQVGVSYGRVGEVKISDSDLEIKNLRKPILEMQISAAGELDAITQYLRDSPQPSAFDGFFKRAEFSGAAQADLDIRLPLIKEGQRSIRGSLELADNGMRFKNPEFELSAMIGKLNFTETTLEFNTLNADFAGNPIQLSARSHADHGQSLITVTARGEVAARSLAELAQLPFAPRLVGSSLWELELSVGGEASAGGVKFEARSDLSGVQFDLPEPFNKASDEAVALQLAVRHLPGTQAQFNLHYGERLKAHLIVDTQAPAVREGVITLGGVGMEDVQPHALVIHGDIASLDVDQHRAFYNQYQNQGSPLKFPPLQFDFQAREMWIWGKPISAAQITGDWQQANLQLVVDAAELSGRITAASEAGSFTSVRARLKHLDYRVIKSSAEDEQAESEADPKTFPALDVLIDRVTYKDAVFKGVQLRTEPSARGMTIHNAGFSNPRLSVSAQGVWELPVESGRTRPFVDLHILLDSDDLEQGFSSIGKAGTFGEGGSAKLDANVRWDGVPYLISRPSLRGGANFTMRQGLLIPIEPGAGRIVGLFALQNIPRRLILDFGDVFKEGLEFQQISGSLNFMEGNAYTTDTKLVSTSGDIEVNGRIGLVAEDFDQEITLRPRLSSSIPALGILSGEPTTGLALWLFQAVLNSIGVEFDQVASVKYTLTGSWDNPITQRVLTEKFNEERQVGN